MSTLVFRSGDSPLGGFELVWSSAATSLEGGFLSPGAPFKGTKSVRRAPPGTKNQGGHVRNRNRRNPFSRNRNRNRPLCQTVLRHTKTPSLEEPPEPKTGNRSTVPSPNRNRTEPNRGHPVIKGTGLKKHFGKNGFGQPTPIIKDGVEAPTPAIRRESSRAWH